MGRSQHCSVDGVDWSTLPLLFVSPIPTLPIAALGITAAAKPGASGALTRPAAARSTHRASWCFLFRLREPKNKLAHTSALRCILFYSSILNGRVTDALMSWVLTSKSLNLAAASGVISAFCKRGTGRDGWGNGGNRAIAHQIRCW